VALREGLQREQPWGNGVPQPGWGFIPNPCATGVLHPGPGEGLPGETLEG